MNIQLGLLVKETYEYQRSRKMIFLRNIWFSASLFNQVKMQIFFEISANIHNDFRWFN